MNGSGGNGPLTQIHGSARVWYENFTRQRERERERESYFHEIIRQLVSFVVGF